MTIRKTLVGVLAALALAGAIGTAAAPPFRTTGRPSAAQGTIETITDRGVGAGVIG